MPAALVADVLATCGSYIDVWKFGWGTAYLDPQLDRKLGLLAEHGIRGCVGGTLLEIAWAQQRVDEFHAWAAEARFPCVEVSRGVAEITLAQKHELIRRFADDFCVLSEVGFKSAAAAMSSDQWAAEVKLDIEAGARWVIAEGRESGTVGIYDTTGVVRDDIVRRLADVAGIDRVIFEAPQKDQQAWFIRTYGANVNLGNIAVAEVLGLETLRLGLRADTMTSAPSPAASTSAPAPRPAVAEPAC